MHTNEKTGFFTPRRAPETWFHMVAALSPAMIFHHCAHREKKEQHSKGYTITGSETANPDNPLQLVTGIAVNPKNIDDSQILHDRADKIKEKTPGLNEIHTDGGYGS